jgi:hypothetical protein
MLGTNVLERGQLRMEPERHACAWKNEPITLTVTEYLILQACRASWCGQKPATADGRRFHLSQSAKKVCAPGNNTLLSDDAP